MNLLDPTLFVSSRFCNLPPNQIGITAQTGRTVGRESTTHEEFHRRNLFMHCPGNGSFCLSGSYAAARADAASTERGQPESGASGSYATVRTTAITAWNCPDSWCADSWSADSTERACAAAAHAFWHLCHR